MKQLNYGDVVDYLLEEFGVLFEMEQKGVYYLLEDSMMDYAHLVWVEQPIESSFELFSFGLEIVRIYNREKHLNPGIMQLLIADNHMDLNSPKLLDKITKGKSAKANAFEPYNNGDLLISSQGEKVAYGRVEEGEFIPITDIGWFLRFGE